MIGLRQRYWKRLGAVLGGLALAAQLLLATAGLVVASAAGPQDVLGAHALCLADGGASQPTQPVDGAPSHPIHAHDALCCLWHQLPGVTPVAAQPAQPVAYAFAAIEVRTTRLIPEPVYGPHNARAPPTLT
jgi:hypothetical protein